MANFSENNQDLDIFEEMLSEQPGQKKEPEPIRIPVEANKYHQPQVYHTQHESQLVSLQPSAIEKPRRRRRRFSCLFLMLAFIFLGFFAWQAWPKKSGTNGSEQGFSFWKSLSLLTKFKLGVDDRVKLKGEEQDRINFVLLGVGGKNHDGGNLADTLIVASFQPSTHKVVMMSIPRDLTVPMTGYGWRKINSASSLAEAKEPGSGGQATADLVGDILEMPIHYYLRVDFAGFIKIIDDMGGVEVEVANTLDDYSYPIMGQEDNPNYYSRFEHLHIEAGRQKMDGELALKYARSRHGVGGEGSDFARSKRQQKILEAVKAKLFNASTIFNPKLIMNIIGDAEDHITTNLSSEELVSLWQLVKDVDQNKITSVTIDNSPEGLLQDMTGQDGAYILTPRTGDFSQIIARFNQAFATIAAENSTANDVSATTTNEKATTSDDETTTLTIAEKDLPSKANAKLDIRNSTTIKGLAARTKTSLQKYGFSVVNTSNTEQKDLAKTTIYDLTYGAKTGDLALLQNKTKAVIAKNIPDWLITETSQLIKNQPSMTQPDFILIIGLDFPTN
ncbi:MAG TPA: LCP family protein [bacterium]|nr:LCP family protein [bacterium]